MPELVLHKSAGGLHSLIAKLTSDPSPSVRHTAESLDRSVAAVWRYRDHAAVREYLDGAGALNLPTPQVYHDSLWRLRTPAREAIPDTAGKGALDTLNLFLVRNSKTPAMLGPYLGCPWRGSFRDGVKIYSVGSAQRACLGMSSTSPLLWNAPYLLFPMSHNACEDSHYHNRTVEVALPLAPGIRVRTGELLTECQSPEPGRAYVIPPMARRSVDGSAVKADVNFPIEITVALPGTAYDRFGTPPQPNTLGIPKFRSDFFPDDRGISWNVFAQRDEGGMVLGYCELSAGQAFELNPFPWRMPNTVVALMSFGGVAQLGTGRGSFTASENGMILSETEPIKIAVPNGSANKVLIAIAACLPLNSDLPHHQDIASHLKRS